MKIRSMNGYFIRETVLIPNRTRLAKSRRVDWHEEGLPFPMGNVNPSLPLLLKLISVSRAYNARDRQTALQPGALGRSGRRSSVPPPPVRDRCPARRRWPVGALRPGSPYAHAGCVRRCVGRCGDALPAFEDPAEGGPTVAVAARRRRVRITCTGDGRWR